VVVGPAPTGAPCLDAAPRPADPAGPFTPGVEPSKVLEGDQMATTMAAQPPRRHPLLYQLNTRVLLRELGAGLGRPATLDDLPDPLLDEIAEDGFDWVWLLGVWQTGPAARAVSRSRADWRAAFQRDLPDLVEEDVAGSPFAIQAYRVAARLGGDEALARVRQRLADRGLRLLLDFVPNHVSPDHPWVDMHPDWFVEGSGDDLARAPSDWIRLRTAHGERVLAHGRDPYFPGWPDTLQLDYRHPGLRAAMRGELAAVAARCDGARCDMAMLVLPGVFHRTWGARPGLESGPFWPEAVAAARGSSWFSRKRTDRSWNPGSASRCSRTGRASPARSRS